MKSNEEGNEITYTIRLQAWNYEIIQDLRTHVTFYIYLKMMHMAS